ncbi:hypothetical protein ACIBKY_49760 [Nonomuraea sp. NPDC050394]|uniref:hypothetical protein n=1 Tax=Nonomuraea sp. NPDC050394 TaxID=3364363 RepID=UPI0037BAF22A
MDDLANSINGLKSKTVNVRANVGPARAAIQRVIRNSQGQVIDVEVRMGRVTARAGARPTSSAGAPSRRSPQAASCADPAPAPATASWQG